MQNDIFESLLAAFPTFSERWKSYLEYWGGESPGIYTDMAEFVHFVVEDLYDRGKIEEVCRVFELMEQQIQQADQEIRDLIGWGFFETLQNVASHNSDGYKVYEQFLGPLSTRMWKQIEKAWEGKSSLADVIRAERGRS